MLGDVDLPQVSTIHSTPINHITEGDWLTMKVCNTMKDTLKNWLTMKEQTQKEEQDRDVADWDHE